MKTFLSIILLLLLMTCPARAVFIATGTPNANTNEPAGDQGWSSMGIYNGACAVYLGGGWFITAGHLGAGATTVKFNSTEYSIASTSWRSLTNSDGTVVDSRLFKINNSQAISVSGAGINATALSVGKSVTMIGYGRNVSSITTNVYTSGGGRWLPSQTQTQVFYYPGTISQMKWGTNTVSGSQAALENTTFNYKSDVLITTLYPGSAQALDKDSGGGVFVYDSFSGSYLLAGVMVYVDLFLDTNSTTCALTDTGSPGANSKTYSVSLSSYRAQITNITAIVDLDGDQLPDWWEYQYSGNATGLVASADNDNDGFSNYQEYIADTNPTNAASFFEMSGFLASTNQTVYFTGSTGREYQVFYTTNDLADTNLVWLAAETNLVWGAGTNSFITVTNTEPKAFYRLKAILP